MKSDDSSKPVVRFPVTERPVSRASVAFDDAFDWVIRYHGGHVLLCVGTIALAVAAAGYYRLLPVPFGAPIFPPHCLGCRQLTALSGLLGQLGVLSLIGGYLALPINRWNRLRRGIVNDRALR